MSVCHCYFYLVKFMVVISVHSIVSLFTFTVHDMTKDIIFKFLLLVWFLVICPTYLPLTYNYIDPPSNFTRTLVLIYISHVHVRWYLPTSHPHMYDGDFSWISSGIKTYNIHPVLSSTLTVLRTSISSYLIPIEPQNITFVQVIFNIYES